MPVQTRAQTKNLARGKSSVERPQHLDTLCHGPEDTAEKVAKTPRSDATFRPPTLTKPCSTELDAERPRRSTRAPHLQTKHARTCDQVQDRNDQERPKRARLTRENLALFNSMGKKQSDLPNPGLPTSTRSKLTSTTSPGFALQADENGMIGFPDSKPPKNLQAILARHAGHRHTASPSSGKYKNYVQRIAGAGNEASVCLGIVQRLLKDYDEDTVEGVNNSYQPTANRPFSGLPLNVGFNNGLAPPQPDFVEGLQLSDFKPFPVRQHIAGAVLYKDDRKSITLPHIAGEWKGPGKDLEKASVQCGYDGAALVYGRTQALAYLNSPDLPGHAEIITFATDGTSIRFFAHYALPENGKLEYHQYQFASVDVMATHSGHIDGRRAMRNHQDHAKRASLSLRRRLVKHWKAISAAEPDALFDASGQTKPVEDGSVAGSEGRGEGEECGGADDDDDGNDLDAGAGEKSCAGGDEHNVDKRG